MLSRHALVLWVICEVTAPGQSTSDQRIAAAEKKAPDTRPVKTDQHGDPLPPGAITRIGTVRFHQYGTTAVAFSPDGKVLASAGEYNRVRLWEPTTGRELRSLEGHRASVNCIAFSPDSKLLASGSHDQEIRLWDVSTGKKLRCLRGNWAGVVAVAFSADGKTLASGCQGTGGDGRGPTVRLWDVRTGKERRLLLKGERFSSLTGVAFSPDGKTLAAGVADRKIHLWDTSTWRLTRTLEGHRDAVTALAFAPDGRHLFSASRDKTVCRWEVATGKQAGNYGPGQNSLSSLAIAPDGKTLAAGTLGGIREDWRPVIYVWETATGKQLGKWEGAHSRGASLRSLAFSPDGKTLASNSRSGIRLWDPVQGKRLNPSPVEERDLACLTFSPDGNTLALGGGGKIRLWNTRTWKEASSFQEVEGDITSVAFSPSGKELASQERPRGIIRLWDVRTGKQQRSYPLQKAWAGALVFSPRGDLLAGLSDNEIVLWDVRRGEEHRRFQIPRATRRVRHIEFLADGRVLAAAGQRGPVCLLDSATGAVARRFGPPKGCAEFAVFSPDGRTLACAGGPTEVYAGWHEDTAVCLWEVAGGKGRRRFPGHEQQVGPAVAFSPNGRVFVSSDRGGSVRLGDVPSGRELCRLREHRGWVVSLVFSPDGKTLASGSVDGTVLIWDVDELIPRQAQAAVELTRERKDRLWAELASDEAARAYQAIWTLADSPGQVEAFLQERLRTSQAVNPQRLARLIADLDAASFRVREKSAQELAQLGALAKPALQEALKGKPALEVRRRIQELLKRLEGKETDLNTLRILRTIEALELTGTPHSRRVLTELAQGGAEPLLTQEVKAALGRLAKRSVAKP